MHFGIMIREKDKTREGRTIVAQECPAYFSLQERMIRNDDGGKPVFIMRFSHSYPRLRGAHNLVNAPVAGSSKAHDVGNIIPLMNSTWFINVRNEIKPLVSFDAWPMLISLLVI